MGLWCGRQCKSDSYETSLGPCRIRDGRDLDFARKQAGNARMVICLGKEHAKLFFLSTLLEATFSFLRYCTRIYTKSVTSILTTRASPIVSYPT